MVGVQGISHETTYVSGAGLASRQQTPKEVEQAPIQDNVAISDEAQALSHIVQKIQEAMEYHSELHAKQVDEAMQRIENGTYKVQSIVESVAARLTRFIGM